MKRRNAVSITKGTSCVGVQDAKTSAMHISASLLKLAACLAAACGIALTVALSAGVAQAASTSSVLTSDGGVLASGEYYLNEDLNLASDIVIADDAEVTIDLNGHTLRGTGEGSVITIGSSGGSGASFTLVDSGTNGRITGGNATNGGGIYVHECSAFTMQGGAVTDNTSLRNGGGVYVYSATFVMSGGELSGNSATYGGGVYIDGNVYDPDLFYYNSIFSAKSVTDEGAFFVMSGGSIVGNSAIYGGGVCMYGGTFSFEDGRISNNSAVSDGGGVFGCGWAGLYEGGIITMSGGEISGNSAEEGAGVYLQGSYGWLKSGSFTMTGGLITENIAESSGGGGYINCAEFFVTGGQILGNTAGKSGAAVYVWNSGVLGVSGSAKIAENMLANGVINNVYVAGNKRDQGAGEINVIGALSEDAYIGISRIVEAPFVAYGTDEYVVVESDAARFADDAERFSFAVSGNTVVYDLSAFGLVERLGGSNRYKTMELISQAAFEDGTCETVVICRGNKFPDALAASGLAGALGGQVLLTKTDSLSSETAAEIARLGAKAAIVVGDENAVSEAACAEIESLVGEGNVSRIVGADRYETALELCSAVCEANTASGVSTSTVIVATGLKAADSLSASSVAYSLAAPIVLVGKSADLSSEALAAITSSEATRVIVLGDEASVSAASESALIEAGLEVVRLGGANRYETSVKVADYAVSTLGFTYAHAAVTAGSGSKYADALVASALCGKAQSPVLLVSAKATSSSDITDRFGTYAADVETAYVLGSEASVTSEMQTAVEYAVVAQLIS